MQTKVSFETILQRPPEDIEDVERRLIGLRIERLLTTHFDTPVETAFWLRVKQTQNLPRWYAGDMLPSAKNLVRMAHLGFNVQWILTGKGYPYDVSTPAGQALADSGLLIVAPTVADLKIFTSDASEHEVQS